MTQNPERRNAFAQAFKDYPLYLMQFVKSHCQLVNPNEPDEIFGGSVHVKTSMALVCFAQFITRLIRTRTNDPNNVQLVAFGFETAQRYNDFKGKLLDDLEIVAEDKYRRAINEIEQNMVNIIIHALAEEVKIDEQAGEKGDFVEADFWLDVFNSFKLIQRTDHPLWSNALRAVILPHMADFRKALEAGNNAAH